MKAIEEALAHRILDKLTYGYGGVPQPHYNTGPYDYGYYGPDILDRVASLRYYHEHMVNWELNNAIAGMIQPSVEAVIKALGLGGKDEAKKVEAKPATPPKAAFLQTEGVPVFVRPTLLSNEAVDVDLHQRNYVIEGVDGFDFLQTEAEGVPVYVRPTLLSNEAVDVDLHQRNYIIDGLDGFDFAQLNRTETIPPNEENVILQVNGVPVLVAPESMIKTDSMTEVGLGVMEIGIDEVNLLQ